MLMDFLQLFFLRQKGHLSQSTYKKLKKQAIFFSNGVLIPTLHPLFKKGGSLRQPLKCDCFCKAPFLAGKNWDCFPNYLTDFRTKKWLMSGNWMPIVHPLVVEGLRVGYTYSEFVGASKSKIVKNMSLYSIWWKNTLLNSIDCHLTED